MKRVILVLIFLHFNIYLFSQYNNKWGISLELSKSFEYSIFSKDPIGVGVGFLKIIGKNNLELNLSFSFLKQEFGRSNTYTFFYQPNILFIHPIAHKKSFQINTKVGGGYSLIKIYNEDYEYKSLQKGFNLSGGLQLALLKFEYIYPFFTFNVIYTRLQKDPDFTILNSYRNIWLLNLGIGVSFGIGKFSK